MASPTSTLRVLVVDDNDDIRDILSMMMQRLGHVADEACDGIEAVAAIEAASYDVMLLDLTMPRMSGQEVLVWLREHPTVATGLRVVVVSALAKEQRGDVEALGAHAVLEKPVRIADLRQAMGGSLLDAPT